MADDEALLVLCTAPDPEVGAVLARGLVDARLAACVNLIPGMRSFYRWDDEVQDDGEVQMLIKTRRARLAEVEQWLTDNHPYDVPEVLALPITAGATAYLRWLQAETT
jgi:periplasmic divalent cation tolerance protein